MVRYVQPTEKTAWAVVTEAKPRFADKLKWRFACLAKWFFHGFQQMKHPLSACLCTRRTHKNSFFDKSKLLIWKMFVCMWWPPGGNMLTSALEWASSSRSKLSYPFFLSACARFVCGEDMANCQMGLQTTCSEIFTIWFPRYQISRDSDHGRQPSSLIRVLDCFPWLLFYFFEIILW